MGVSVVQHSFSGHETFPFRVGDSNPLRTRAKAFAKDAVALGVRTGRHYFQTGTLRYFEVAYGDRGDFRGGLFRERLTGESADADGCL